MEYQALGFHGNESFRYRGLETTKPKNSSQVPISALGIHLQNLFFHTKLQWYWTSSTILSNMKLKCLASISSIFNHSKRALYITGLWQNMTKKNSKHVGDGFPWIFKEPKNCYWWFLMNSGHGTEKLFLMGIEILGFGIYCCIE